MAIDQLLIKVNRMTYDIPKIDYLMLTYLHEQKD